MLFFFCLFVFLPLTLPKKVNVTVSQQKVKGLKISFHMACAHSHHLKIKDKFCYAHQ